MQSSSRQIRCHDPKGILDSMSSKITEPLPGPFFKNSIELTWAEHVWDEPDQGDDWDGEVMMARWLGYATPGQVLELKRLTGDGAEDMP